MRIFFFERRNPANGELTGDIIDTDEKIGRNHFNSPRLFKYVGWSDGRFMSAVKQKAEYNTKTGMMKIAKKGIQDKIRQAALNEIEFAKSNSDKTPPRDLTKKNLEGQPLTDPQLLSALR